MQPISGELVEMMQEVMPWYFKYCKVLQDNIAWGSHCMLLIEQYQAFALCGCISHTVQTEDLLFFALLYLSHFDFQICLGARNICKANSFES